MVKQKGWGAKGKKERLSDPLIMDFYHMLQGHLLFAEGLHKQKVVFDYFVRRTLPKSSYHLVAGTEEVLKRLSCLKFSKKDIRDIREKFEEKDIILTKEFIRYLKDFRFNADVWAIREGDLAFPDEPIIRVEGEMFECLIVESMIESKMNYPSGVATKASRIVKAAQGKSVADFSLRRSPNGKVSTRATIIGGFESTSNVREGIDKGIPISGTSAHSIVQSLTKLLGSEKEAFKVLLKYMDTLIVDTFTIEQGIKNAISAAKELRTKVSIRIDSGDLIESAFLAREMDTEGWINRIILTNDLDEFKINKIMKSGAEVDGFGVGTYVANPFPPVGGVYKLVSIEKDGEFQSAIKVSGDEIKILLPGRKNVWRKKNKEGKFIGDLIALVDEADPGNGYEPVLVQAMSGGKIIIPKQSVLEIRAFSQERLASLQEKHSRIENPRPYPVIISERLQLLKKTAIEEALEMSKN